jgi:2-polyprenyl-6-methoxyphenol hydroxylase-like FAD-dependent oxidoreductase
LVPADVKRGFLAVRAIPRPIGMALGLVEFAEPVTEAASRFGVRLTPTEDYLMFALTAPLRCFPHPDAIMSTLDGERLRETAIGMTRRWHPNLRELPAHCVVEEDFYLAIRVSRPVLAWTTGPVTLLGDAVHAMSPAVGSGPNIALRDAAPLARRLSTTDRDTRLGAYEREMLDYGCALPAAASG